MSFVRAIPVLLSLAVNLAPPEIRAQSHQPWAGAGIQAAEGRGTTRFTIRVENISTGEVLKLSNGRSAAFVSAPVLWVTHTGSTNPIFTGGKRDAGQGLELLAETGNPSMLVAALAGNPGIVAAGAAARPVGATTEGPITPADDAVSSR